MKVYKVTLMIIDYDGVGDGIKSEIENVRYPNRCLRPKVMDIDGVDIGEWEDENPLNFEAKAKGEFDRLFGMEVQP